MKKNQNLKISKFTFKKKIASQENILMNEWIITFGSSFPVKASYSRLIRLSNYKKKNKTNKRP